MSLLADVQHAILDAVDEYDDVPDHIVIEPADDSADEYVAIGSWWEHDETELVTGEETLELPYMNKHEVALTGDVQVDVHQQFTRFHENIMVTGAECELDPTLIQSTTDSELEQAIDADFRFINYVWGENQKTLNTAHLEAMCSPIREELDPTIKPDYLRNIEFIFSDVHASHLMNIRLDIHTPNPHHHYSNTDSLEEYIDTADEMDIDTSGETYEVFQRLRVADGDVDTDLIEFGEQRILTLGHAHIDADIDYVIEAERLTYDETEEFAFYLNVPIDK